MKTINFAEQFNLMMAFIKQTWQLPAEEMFENAAKIAFNQGLSDGRISVDPYITFRVGQEINGDTDELSPIYQRDINPDIIHSYDGLCLFDKQLYLALRELQSSQKYMTVHTNQQYQHRLGLLLQKLSDFNLHEISPKPLTRSQEQALIDGYSGYRVDNNRSSMPMPERLSLSCNETMHIPAFKLLISAIYSFGLDCAKEKNELDLMAVLVPIYQNYRDKPFNAESHLEFMPTLRQLDLFQLIEAAKPFTFFTNAQYQDYLKELKQHREKLAHLNDEERAAIHAQMMDSIFSELDDEELSENVMGTYSNVDAQIKQSYEKLSVYSI